MPTSIVVFSDGVAKGVRGVLQNAASLSSHTVLCVALFGDGFDESGGGDFAALDRPKHRDQGGQLVDVQSRFLRHDSPDPGFGGWKSCFARLRGSLRWTFHERRRLPADLFPGGALAE